MEKFKKRNLLSFFLVLLLMGCAQVKEASRETKLEILPPEELYGDLFYEVQSNEQLFPDSKTFVDAIPIYNVDVIKDRFAELPNKNTSTLNIFLEDHFIIPENNNIYQTDSSSIRQHISKLWNVLKRPADEKISGTLIPLPNPYIVPGGRFREIYYWDSYFTMLGLAVDGETETIRNMVDNFSYLIDTYGFIPNGNRTYYLGRSQPPFYAKMVEVLADIEGSNIYVDYLPFLQKEYDFWMKGSEGLNNNQIAINRVVKLPDGEILNRYWDENQTPRPESYREDVETANEALERFPNKSREEVYRNIRAAAESGWDFSSRWLKKEQDSTFRLSTIHTTEILPVDLNSLLYNLESTLERAYKLKGDLTKTEEYKTRKEARKKAINKYFWNNPEGYYMDYNFREKKPTEVISLAGVYPLFFEIADAPQADKVAQKVEDIFVKPGGVVTTPYNTGQQWDAPNGWAPLQWITIDGLKKYGHTQLALNIENSWLQLNTRIYKRSYKLLEKYNVEDLSKESGGGEYPTQDGFGWTNGVYQKLAKD
jgi:alpha,alpha-trehalase